MTRSHCFPLENPADPGVQVSPGHVHLHRCCKLNSFSFLPNLTHLVIQWKPRTLLDMYFPLHSSCHLRGSGPISDVRTATKPPKCLPVFCLSLYFILHNTVRALLYNVKSDHLRPQNPSIVLDRKAFKATVQRWASKGQRIPILHIKFCEERACHFQQIFKGPFDLKKKMLSSTTLSILGQNSTA